MRIMCILDGRTTTFLHFHSFYSLLIVARADLAAAVCLSLFSSSNSPLIFTIIEFAKLCFLERKKKRAFLLHCCVYLEVRSGCWLFFFFFLLSPRRNDPSSIMCYGWWDNPKYIYKHILSYFLFFCSLALARIKQDEITSSQGKMNCGYCRLWSMTMGALK